MARGSLGAGGSLSRFTGQGLRSTLLFPFFILWQKDTDPLGGGGHTDFRGQHFSKGFPRFSWAERGGMSHILTWGRKKAFNHTLLFLQRHHNSTCSREQAAPFGHPRAQRSQYHHQPPLPSVMLPESRARLCGSERTPARSPR